MITYLIKFTVCGTLILLFYRAALEREKMLVFNRFFLLSGLLLSFLIPFIVLPFHLGNDFVRESAPLLSNVPVTETSEAIPTVEKQSFTTLRLMTSLYLLGVLVFTLRFIRNLFVLARNMFRAPKIRKDGVTLVLVPEATGICSFLHYIFVHQSTYQQGGIEKEVLIHELAHVRQMHTLDILLIESIQLFFLVPSTSFLLQKSHPVKS